MGFPSFERRVENAGDAQVRRISDGETMAILGSDAVEGAGLQHPALAGAKVFQPAISGAYVIGLPVVLVPDLPS